MESKARRQSHGSHCPSLPPPTPISFATDKTFSFVHILTALFIYRCEKRSPRIHVTFCVIDLSLSLYRFLFWTSVCCKPFNLIRLIYVIVFSIYAVILRL
uniref:NAC domain-containing protein 86 isoform X2 n=1 Tax=Rhizophora mucronata TaxID=61149 RepID=A0A2P2LF18_RHIMU